MIIVNVRGPSEGDGHYPQGERVLSGGQGLCQRHSFGALTVTGLSLRTE